MDTHLTTSKVDEDLKKIAIKTNVRKGLENITLILQHQYYVRILKSEYLLVILHNKAKIKEIEHKWGLEVITYTKKKKKFHTLFKLK